MKIYSARLQLIDQSVGIVYSTQWQQRQYQLSQYKNRLDQHKIQHSNTAPTNQELKQVILPEGYVSSQWYIKEMDCPVEEHLIYQVLSKQPNINDVDCNLLKRVLTVSHHPDAKQAIEEQLRTIGMVPKPLEQQPTQRVEPHNTTQYYKLALAGGVAAIAEVLDWFAYPEWMSALAALVAILICGLQTYKKGWLALRHRNLNINALMSVAVTGAMIIGQWPEAAMVMFLFTLAEMLESVSISRAQYAIQDLVALAPSTAKVLQTDGSWLEQQVEQVELSAVVRVTPGEQFPLDGNVINGHSTVNQAAITGESLPIEKSVGDKVFAGTLNQSGVIEFQVTAIGNDSTLARIASSVQAAQNAKAPIQRFIDQFSRIYTPIIFIIALLVALLPPLLTDQSWFDWVYRGLVLLVIACPCALVISTPLTMVSGLTNAARQGILVKGGAFLELGRKLSWLAMDKTGTLTQGKPEQTDCIVFEAEQSSQIQLVAVSLAARSDHPVSKAIFVAAKQHQSDFYQVDQFSALVARGVTGTINNVQYWLGNYQLMAEQGILKTASTISGLTNDALLEQIAQLEQQGKTVILLANSQQILALFAVADTLRTESIEAIARLHALGVKTMMLTGDNTQVANTIAHNVGIDRVYSELLPEDKLNIIAEKVHQGEIIGMVGDGINDAPALAGADIGFAMGQMGSDTAIETADVALMDDDLRKIADFLILSKRTYRLLMQNIVLALGIKFIFLIITLLGMASMWMAVFADVGTTMLVILNGLRLLKR